MKSKIFVVLCLSVFFLPLLVSGRFSQAAAQAAAATSPVGRWKTIDDRTGKVKSLITIWEAGGKLYGRIEKIVNPDADNPDHKCIHCDGAMKGKELIGMQILSEMKPDGGQWSGGTIFDPDNGKTYKCLLELQDGGKKLKVRGYIGFSLLGRTQYWYRDE